MTVVFEIRNADNSLQFGLDSRVLRVLEVRSTGTTNGSVSVVGATQGSVVGVELNAPDSGITPEITASGTTVSWNFGTAPVASRRSVDFAIAVY